MARITGTGRYLPEHVVKNADLTQFMDTSDEWIQTRSGIKERRWVRRGNEKFQGTRSAELSERASLSALQSAGIAASDVGLIVYCTISADNEIPGSGTILLERLGISCPVYEVRNHCSAFLYGLSIAHAYIDSGSCDNAVVVGVEIQSSGLNLSTPGRTTAVLFGDGAGAVVLSKGEGILDIKLASDGEHAGVLGVECPSFARTVPISNTDFAGETPPVFPRMDGQLVFKMASIRMPEVVRAVVKQSGFSIEDLALIIPHQANQRILDMLGRDLGCPEKVFSNIARYGNTTAGTIPIAMSEAAEEGRLKRDDLVCLVSFGAGFAWGAILLRWIK